MIRRVLKESFVLLHVDHVTLDDKWNYRNVLSPYYRMYYIDSGEGLIYHKKQTWTLEPGFMYLIPGFTLCNLKCSGHLSQYFIHFFEDAVDGISLFHNHQAVFKIRASPTDIDNFKRLLHINPGRKINRSDNPQVYEKHIYYKEYEELNNNQSDHLFLETQGILLQLISKFVQLKSAGQPDAASIPSKVLELPGFIQLNLGNPLTVHDLARMVNLHPDYLSRLFVKLTGQRPWPISTTNASKEPSTSSSRPACRSPRSRRPWASTTYNTSRKSSKRSPVSLPAATATNTTPPRSTIHLRPASIRRKLSISLFRSRPRPTPPKHEIHPSRLR
ncbi:helix-turn-helix domain-containing protein [Puia sp. P3]|uniref:helix-turn-helix domain-containing protein n=1 Tax=Puia sp. P3 TaxID=3423952 RepID=UPI003D67F67C